MPFFTVTELSQQLLKEESRQCPHSLRQSQTAEGPNFIIKPKFKASSVKSPYSSDRSSGPRPI